MHLWRNKIIRILCFFILIIIFTPCKNHGFIISRLIIDFHSLMIIHIEIILFVNRKILRHYNIVIVSHISFWTIFSSIIKLINKITLNILNLLLLMDLIFILVHVAKVLILKILWCLCFFLLWDKILLIFNLIRIIIIIVNYYNGLHFVYIYW